MDFDVVVVGAGMVGSSCAAALTSSEFTGVSVALVGPRTGHWPSSHDDVTRIVSSDRDDAKRSLAAFPEVQKKSGITFYQPSGCLSIGAGAGGEIIDGLSGLKDTLFSLLGPGVAEIVQGGPGCESHFKADGGWINPRLFVKAQTKIAEDGGVSWIKKKVAAINNCEASLMVVLDDGTRLRCGHALLCLGAFSDQIKLNRGLPVMKKGSKLWGKSLYHARISQESEHLHSLRNIPTVVLHYSACASPESVQYSGSKKGFYVYFFPCTLYPDGGAYLKIGHSPFDPYISELSGKDEDEKLEKWMNSLGDEVKSIQAASEKFFREALAVILPGVDFDLDKSFSSHCVTTKTLDGEVDIGAVAPRIFACTGCNGALPNPSFTQMFPGVDVEC